MSAEKPYEGRLIAKHLKFLLDNSEEIAGYPRFFWCMPNCSLWERPCAGRFDLPLGVLVSCWSERELVIEKNHPNLNGVYIYASSGDPFYGKSWYRGTAVGMPYPFFSEIINTDEERCEFAVKLTTPWLKAKKLYAEAERTEGLSLMQVIETLSPEEANRITKYDILYEIDNKAHLPFHERYKILIDRFGEEKTRRWEQDFLNSSGSDDSSFEKLFSEDEE